MSYEKTLITLQKVKPTKTILIKSFNCEQQNAHIRNKSEDAMNKNDVHAVTYRYLQSKKGENVTFVEALFWGMSTIAFCANWLYLYNELILLTNEKTDNNPGEVNQLLTIFAGFLAFTCLVPFVSSAVNVNNTKRYNETNKGCEDWLQNKVGDRAVENIKTLSYHEYKYNYKNRAEQFSSQKFISIEEQRSELKP